MNGSDVVETTWPFPGGGDRMAEIVVVRVAPGGTAEDPWSTLVKPGRHVRPQGVHRISAADVRQAPKFGEAGFFCQCPHCARAASLTADRPTDAIPACGTNVHQETPPSIDA